MARWDENTVWLAVGHPDNPFDFEVLDCRIATAAFVHTRASEELAPAVRAIEAMALGMEPETTPVDPLVIACNVEVAFSGTLSLAAPGPGHCWSLQAREHRILARRRWTGQTIHAADFQLAGQRLRVERLVSNGDAVYNDPAFAIAEFRFLLSVYLSRELEPFPAPPDLGPDDRAEIARRGWIAYGPIARYARMI